MTNRTHNFSAGPCTLPLQVLKEAQQEFLDYQGAGMSIIEMNHRGEHFQVLSDEAMKITLEIFQVPNDFSILFLQGGATLQFSMVPMNFLHDGKKGAYVNSGTWARAAITDAKQYGNVYTVWDGTEYNNTRMPYSHEIAIQNNTRYLHITTNETIDGIRYPEWPKVDIPLIGDVSSDYMARPIAWEKFDLIYGGIQKNLGPAGMTVVFVRKSILKHTNKNIGRYLRYDVHHSHQSLFNTPPVFSIYIFGKVMKWMKQNGGLSAMEKNAETKSNTLYKAIDESGGYYNCPVDSDFRSHMNVVFRLKNEELESKFLSEASDEGLMNLKGHRIVGGCRASLYNALPYDSVLALVTFMENFQRKNSE